MHIIPIRRYRTQFYTENEYEQCTKRTLPWGSLLFGLRWSVSRLYLSRVRLKTTLFLNSHPGEIPSTLRKGMIDPLQPCFDYFFCRR